ncbi:hypothetical protein CHS0354_007272 [Potamilus streckersoni]|uniref:Uncharacterized protein n=1 Tax=Potamilus streckersoni TaxID=2493646 RepID=A0AAE0TD85_9BIVA|nr:hypothetical protein CHS0354_007272 [Potamilus streckersoni]
MILSSDIVTEDNVHIKMFINIDLQPHVISILKRKDHLQLQELHPNVELKFTADTVSARTKGVGGQFPGDYLHISAFMIASHLWTSKPFLRVFEDIHDGDFP